MEMFGERFYPLLNKLAPWKQSLFALALAQRQLANYWLWADLTAKGRGAAEYNHCLTRLWQYHQDKFNHVDLEAALEVFQPFVPDVDQEPDPEDPSTGTLLALDAALCLTAACDGIILHEGNEAEIASRASLAAAVLTAQQQHEEYLDEEALRSTPVVDNEVNYQVSLLELLIKGRRETELMHLILKSALKDGCSNIGLTIPPEAGLDCSFEHYALSAEALAKAAAEGRSALPELNKPKPAVKGRGAAGKTSGKEGSGRRGGKGFKGSRGKGWSRPPQGAKPSPWGPRRRSGSTEKDGK